ncbi:MAG: mandelate racemase [Gemmatimonadetes bacterium]|nr:mandelate racemase [Gemmatimonadota bacterium]
MARLADAVPIRGVEGAAYRIPTSSPESDGTLEWDATTLIAVDVEAAGTRGFGYGYADAAAADLIGRRLAGVVEGLDAMAIQGAWDAMLRETRNIGHPGLVKAAIGAVDVALWDLKAKLLDVSVSVLLGARRESVPVYGSGGFTSYDLRELQEQLAGWVEAGIPRVKMKIGREPDRDVERVRAVREAIGADAELFVDANGAFTAAEALGMAARLEEFGVTWFEEPVSSDDRAGLRHVREGSPAGMRITAGEYGYDAFYFRRMCEEGCVDVLQPDPVRTGGFTGFLRCAEVCDAFSTPISSHTAPQLAAHVCLATPRTIHAELFHDHQRIAGMLLDGALEPVGGELAPDRSRPGLGLTLKAPDAGPYRVA